MNKASDTVLLMDDEPNVLDWLIEYIESKGYQTKIAINIDDAIKELDRMEFRVAIFDLNAPASKEVLMKLEERGSVYSDYRGLYAAEYARKKGLRGRQVIVYSVHDSEDVLGRCERIGVQYLIKARPRQFKRELDGILSFDPTKREV